MSGRELVAGKYEVLWPLGAGGMGRVFAARRLHAGDVVALKRLLPSRDTPRNRDRLLREAQAAAHIRHPGVVQVFDVDLLPDGAPFVVMELVDGPTLEEALRARGPLPPDRVAEIFAELCAAVEAGHRRGVLHRDLTARNVLLGRTDDGREAVKLVDFGIARLGAGPGWPGGDGDWVGTLGYAAPEVIAGAEPGPACDVFALGVLLHQLLTGRMPFEARTPAGFLATVGRPSLLSRADLQALPAPMLGALGAMLDADPARRPRSPLAAAAAVLRDPAHAWMGRRPGAAEARPLASLERALWRARQGLERAGLTWSAPAAATR